MIYDGFSAVLASVLGAMVSTILALVLPTELFLVTLFVGFTFSTIMFFQMFHNLNVLAVMNRKCQGGK